MKIGALFGIDIRIDRTFWLLPVALAAWMGWQYGSAVGIRMFALVLLVFVCVLGHELSHGWAARRFGIQVPYITLYPMGGVASMQRIPAVPLQEFLISIVGPFFNFALALLLYFPFLAFFGREALFSPGLDSWPQTFASVFWVNPVLGFFNLVPAFPMDGGRIFRSLLALKLEYLVATRISVILGQIFAILFFLLGLWKSHWMLTLVGIYVYQAAGREMKQARNEFRPDARGGGEELS